MHARQSLTVWACLAALCVAYLAAARDDYHSAVSQRLASITPEERAALRKRFYAEFGHLLQAPRAGLQQDDVTLHTWAKNVTCERQQICRDIEICANVCKEGTVEIDPWLANALRTQRALQLNTPLNFISLPGTHNSAITKANGYGVSEDYLTDLVQLIDPNWIVWIANQQISVTDQLNLGIRHVELDVHWLDGYIRICHAGGIHLQYLDEFIQWLSKELHIPIDWDSETIGCFSPQDRHLNTTFDILRKWFDDPKNAQEFVIFYFDDQEDLELWGKVHLIIQGIDHYFGAAAFTPIDKQKYFPDSWPSIAQLLQLKKQMMFVSRTDFKAEMSTHIFARDALWTEWGPDSVRPYPSCTIAETNQRTENGNVTRLLGDSLSYGPFWAGYTGGLYMPGNLLQSFQCAVDFPCTDQVSPTLMQGAVWSWDRGEPQQGGCAVLKANGRWGTAACDQRLKAACVSTSDASKWVASAAPAVAANATLACGGGFAFGVPANGYQNSVLAAAAAGQTLWLNYSPSF